MPCEIRGLANRGINLKRTRVRSISLPRVFGLQFIGEKGEKGIADCGFRIWDYDLNGFNDFNDFNAFNGLIIDRFPWTFYILSE